MDPEEEAANEDDLQDEVEVVVLPVDRTTTLTLEGLGRDIIGLIARRPELRAIDLFNLAITCRVLCTRISALRLIQPAEMRFRSQWAGRKKGVDCRPLVLEMLKIPPPERMVKPLARPRKVALIQEGELRSQYPCEWLRSLYTLRGYTVEVHTLAAVDDQPPERRKMVARLADQLRASNRLKVRTEVSIFVNLFLVSRIFLFS
jgi:hypothetical protein